MKGLLLRAWYAATKPLTLLVLLLFGIEAAVPSFTVDPNESEWFECIIFGTMTTLIGSSVSVALLGEDEMVRWHIFSATTPAARHTYVSCHYLVTVITAAVFTLLSSLASLVLLLKTTGFDGKQYLLALAVISGIVMVVLSLLLPAVFRFGAKTGLVVFIVLFIAVVALCAVLTVMSSQNGEWMQWLENTDKGFLALGIFACAGTIFAVSWLLSIAGYKRRSL